MIIRKIHRMPVIKNQVNSLIFFHHRTKCNDSLLFDNLLRINMNRQTGETIPKGTTRNASRIPMIISHSIESIGSNNFSVIRTFL